MTRPTVTRRVLLIDDEELIREVVEVSLAKVGGWEVLTASSGEEGLGKAVAERPDAVLLDVMMPGLDGPGTLARLQADPATAAIPVVFLTAKVRQSEQQQWVDRGAAGVLVKPFDPMLLASQVAEVLGW
ncbi:MAG: response regulator [Actinomycetota bacterium]|jgi:CheY-like chemotaxis protein|nr:response regulator [Actinomycetota bacterium]